VIYVNSGRPGARRVHVSSQLFVVLDFSPFRFVKISDEKNFTSISRGIGNNFRACKLMQKSFVHCFIGTDYGFRISFCVLPYQSLHPWYFLI
jgi:hypothetical protein